MYWLLVFVIIVLLLYYLIIKPQLYWKAKHVNQGFPIPIFGDNYKVMFFQQTISDMLINVYNRFKNVRYSGMYLSRNPVLMLRDPELIKQLTVKEFNHFMDHRDMTAKEIDPLWARSVVGLKGESWREMRSILSPAFTSAKMRTMFMLMEECAMRYVNFYMKKKQNLIEVELRDSFARFSNDVMASCAFGIEVDSLNEPDNEFYKHGRGLINLDNSFNFIFWLNTVSTNVGKILNLHLFSETSAEFFKKIVLETIKLREKININRPDVMNLLIAARKNRLQYKESKELDDTGRATVEESDYRKPNQNNKNNFSDTEMAAQMFVFYFAGFETTSTMLSFLFYELANQPDIQMKLIIEIQATWAKTDGKLTYDALNKMKYLDMVITESLRKYPPVTMFDRCCTKPYTIQPEQPDERPVHLTPGDIILVPVIALHHDEEYYPNPDRFIPERFADENKHNIRPYTYFPFGSGPRNCVGAKFSLMEAKTLLFYVLKYFELTVIDKTNVPMKFAKGTINLNLDGGFWVGFKLRL